jgi:hypothetical protein
MMKKNKLMSLVLAIIGAALVIGGLYLLISYLNYFGQGLIQFVSANNVETISRCGIVVPDMFLQLRDQFATAIIPVLYLGIPVAVILISVIWFLSGYYLGKSRIQEDLESEAKRKMEIEEEVQKRVGGRKSKSPKEEEGYEEVGEVEMEEEPEEYEEEPVKRKKSRRR